MKPLWRADDRPSVVTWEVTPRRQLAGRPCLPEAPADALDHPQCEDLLDQIASIAPRLFILAAGDPAPHLDVLEIISSANARGLSITFRPDATPRLLRMNFDHLREAGVRGMVLRLGGACERTHNVSREIDGTWEWTMRAFTAARRAGISVQIHTTFTTVNLDEWPEFTKLIQQLQPRLWSMSLPIPAGRAEAGQMPAPDQTERLLHHFAQFPGITGIPVKTTETPHFRRVGLQTRSWRPGMSLPGRFALNADRVGIFVSHTGDIRPGECLPITCGNVKTEDLLDVYRTSPVFQALRDPNSLKGKCGRCEYRRICGGSRARAYAMSGDFLAEEPTCSHQPRRVRAEEWALAPA